MCGFYFMLSVNRNLAFLRFYYKKQKKRQLPFTPERSLVTFNQATVKNVRQAKALISLCNFAFRSELLLTVSGIGGLQLIPGITKTEQIPGGPVLTRFSEGKIVRKCKNRSYSLPKPKPGHKVSNFQDYRADQVQCKYSKISPKGGL